MKYMNCEYDYSLNVLMTEADHKIPFDFIEALELSHLILLIARMHVEFGRVSLIPLSQIKT
jgi:hypothetical protein